MANYDKQEFEEYLSTKVAESTAKIYATDMVVCVKALEQIKLYEGKELVEILEDFVSHKKAVKNYLQEEFLKALVDVGSNDSGLYDSLASKAKHYLAMCKTTESETVPESISSNPSSSIVKIKLTGYATNNTGDETGDEYIDENTIYSSSLDNIKELSNYEILQKVIRDKKLLKEVYDEWLNSNYDYFNIHYIELDGKVYDGEDAVYESFEDFICDGYAIKLIPYDECINLI